MKTSIQALLAAALIVTTQSACSKIDPIVAPAPRGGDADYSVYVALGTSITAGTQSGGLVVHHQEMSYAYGFARQAGAAAFTIPSISAHGIPPLLELHSLSPPVVGNGGRTAGSPTNLDQPTAYHNMAVPGAILLDVVSSDLYGRSPGTQQTFDRIVRGRGTVLSEAASLSPTFITLEYGSNEVLGPASGGSGTPVLSGPEYAGLLAVTLDAIEQAAPGVKMAIVNVPDVTTIPFFTTFSWVALDEQGNPSPLIGPDGPLQPGDLVLLTAGSALAQGTGFATDTRSYLTGIIGNGQPLTDQQVLSVAEAASIQAAVDGYNAAIDAALIERGAALLDLNRLLEQGATTGFRHGGATYTSDYISGGLFSLDGIHPTDFSHGLLLNNLIRSVNAKFGSRIPLANLGDYATATPSRQREFGAGGAIPVVSDADAIYEQMFPVRSPLSVPTRMRR